MNTVNTRVRHYRCSPWCQVTLAAMFWLGTAQAGSLYSEQQFRPLTADQKAHHVGDALTVLIYENSSASSTANTSTGRDGRTGLDIRGTGKSWGFGVSGGSQTDGRGRTQRGGQVLAQMTVTVKGISENGDLLIGGEQLLEVNNEKQQIKLQGRVRSADISEQNTVLSTRVAEAKISFVGEGDLAEKQRPSWWQRLLSWFGG